MQDVIYRLIPRDNNRITQYRGDKGASELAAHFLGRRISAYIVVKSSPWGGDRVVDLAPANGCVQTVENLLRAN